MKLYKVIEVLRLVIFSILLSNTSCNHLVFSRKSKEKNSSDKNLEAPQLSEEELGRKDIADQNLVKASPTNPVKPKSIEVLDDVAKQQIESDAKLLLGSLYDSVDENIPFKERINIKHPDCLSLYNIIKSKDSPEKILNEIGKIKNFVESLTSKYGEEGVYNHIIETVKSITPSITPAKYGSFKSYKIDGNYLHALMKFYCILKIKFYNYGINFNNNLLLDRLDGAFDKFTKDFPIYNHIYLYEKGWTNIDSLDSLLWLDISVEMNEKVHFYNESFLKEQEAMSLYFKTDRRNVDHYVELITNFSKEYEVRIIPFFITDQTYTECMILKFEKGRCTKILGSTDAQTYNKRYELYKRKINSDNPTVKKILNVCHDGNCSAYSQYNLLYFAKKVIELINNNPDLSYAEAQIKVFDDLYDNVDYCEVSEKSLYDSQILAEFGISKLLTLQKQ